MIAFAFVFIGLPAAALIVWLLAGPMPAEVHQYRVIDWISLIGSVLGYLGVVFSGYAAYGVSALSKKYFSKVRLPAVRENLETLAIKLGEIAELPAATAMSETIFSQVPVQLRALKRMNAYKDGKLIDKLIGDNTRIVAWLTEHRYGAHKLKDCDEMWVLYNQLHMISSELTAAIEDEKAR